MCIRDRCVIMNNTDSKFVIISITLPTRNTSFLLVTMLVYLIPEHYIHLPALLREVSIDVYKRQAVYEGRARVTHRTSVVAVSYTHLDVYKRQYKKIFKY